jgi:hypothetical protein
VENIGKPTKDRIARIKQATVGPNTEQLIEAICRVVFPHNCLNNQRSFDGSQVKLLARKKL